MRDIKPLVPRLCTFSIQTVNLKRWPYPISFQLVIQGRGQRGNTHIVAAHCLGTYHHPPTRSYESAAMALASKTESQNLFAKLKQKPANRVGKQSALIACLTLLTSHRSASTAAPRIPAGARYPLASISVSTAPLTTGTSASTFLSCGPRTSTVRA